MVRWGSSRSKQSLTLQSCEILYERLGDVVILLKQCFRVFSSDSCCGGGTRSAEVQPAHSSIKWNRVLQLWKSALIIIIIIMAVLLEIICQIQIFFKKKRGARKRGTGRVCLHVSKQYLYFTIPKILNFDSMRRP